MFTLVMFLSVLMVLVIYFDATRYIIPNWLVGLLLLAYPALFLMGQTPDWRTGLICLGVAFALGFTLFLLKLMGGGDVKLLAACCLWTGTQALSPFLLYTAIFGGALSLILLLGRPMLRALLHFLQPERVVPRLFQQGAPAPYGLAIAGGFLVVLWQGKMNLL